MSAVPSRKHPPRGRAAATHPAARPSFSRRRPLAACPPGDDIVGGVALGPDGAPAVIRCDGGRCECALPYCEQVCARPEERLCLFDCGDATTCVNGCPGGDCSLQCGADASCALQCDGGGCDGRCDDSRACDLGCAGGGCDLTCVGAAECVMKCPGGGCSLTCDGTARCELLDCAEGCQLDCGGAETCVASCVSGPGCSVTP